MKVVEVVPLLERVHKKRLLMSLGFSFLFALTILAEFLLIKYSTHSYGLNLFFSILLAVLFLVFAVFFFTVPFSSITKWCRFAEGATHGERKSDVYEIVGYKEGVIERDGLSFVRLEVVEKRTLEKQSRDFLLLDNEKQFEKGALMELTTYGPYLIEAKLWR